MAFEAASPYVLAQLAARGLGVAVLPADEESVPNGPLRTLRIVRPRLCGRVALAWQSAGPASPAARALLDRLRDALPSPRGRATTRPSMERPREPRWPGHRSVRAGRGPALFRAAVRTRSCLEVVTSADHDNSGLACRHRSGLSAPCACACR
ncbi:LysR substrate-binding domain-containing protein [Streptomyces sp. NPDC006971]|uniref:LysR substrate-binding domain-containing protein n=1 Tax=Streptomyces sp. NPDC006971 TaxID=3154784 RepID=UPI0033CE9C50